MDCNNCKHLEQCSEEEWIVTSRNGKDCDLMELKDSIGESITESK